MLNRVTRKFMAIHFPYVPATYRNIPKTGTTSFKWWARDHISDCEILEDPTRIYNMQHLTLEEIKDRWSNYGTTFTFVRNPFDRMVSIFHHVGQDAEARIKQRPLGGTKEQYGVRQEELDSIPIEIDIKILQVYRRGFDHWIHSDIIPNYDDALNSLLHQKESQMYWLNNVIPNVVVKIEEVEDKFKTIQDLLNCHVPFIHINKSNHTHYKDYYNDSSKRIVEDLFKDDLNAFNYDF
jgi:hypothetical protein